MKVFGIARLTNFPEQVAGRNGPITKIRLAWNTGRGDRKKSNFLNAVAFGKTAELLKTVSKGHRILVEGTLRAEPWQTDDKKGVAHEIYINEFSYIEPRDDNRQAQPQNNDGLDEQFSSDNNEAGA